jgi:hypothetical protein
MILIMYRNSMPLNKGRADDLSDLLNSISKNSAFSSGRQKAALMLTSLLETISNDGSPASISVSGVLEQLGNGASPA